MVEANGKKWHGLVAAFQDRWLFHVDGFELSTYVWTYVWIHITDILKKQNDKKKTGNYFLTRSKQRYTI